MGEPMDVSLVQEALQLVGKLNTLADFALEEIKRDRVERGERAYAPRQSSRVRCKVHKGFVEDCCGA